MLVKYYVSVFPLEIALVQEKKNCFIYRTSTHLAAHLYLSGSVNRRSLIMAQL